MQLLPHGPQDLPRMTVQRFPHQSGNRQRKTASEQLVDHKELLPMRLAQVRAGIRRRPVWSMFKSILATATS
jgi:hypothetical protein